MSKSSNLMPDTIMARPMMGAEPQDETHKSGPWSLDDPYSNAVEYTRIDLSEAEIAQARREGWNAATEAAAEMSLGATLIIAPESVSQRVGADSVRKQIKTAILALMDKEQADEN